MMSAEVSAEHTDSPVFAYPVRGACGRRGNKRGNRRGVALDVARSAE
jgi:hypothetical protein